MIVPKYLENIVIIKDNKENNCSLDICCNCGCKEFYIYKNIKEKQKISEENRRKIKETDRWDEEVFSPLITNYNGIGPINAAYYAYYPEEKYREIIIYDCKGLNGKFDPEKDKSRIVKVFKVNFGEVPLDLHEIKEILNPDFTKIIKAKCSKCYNEYILFDNRIHGCDSIEFTYQKFKEYKYKEFKIKGKLGKPYKINIYIENYWGEDNLDNLNEGLTSDDYSILFNYIKIQLLTEDNKKVTILSEDLG